MIQPADLIYLCDGCAVEETAALCREHGFGIEVQAFYDPAIFERESDPIGRHRQVIAGISRRSLHGPFGDLSPGSCDALIRQVTRSRFDLACQTAQQLGIHHIILHDSYVPHTNNPKNYIQRAAALWRELLAQQPPEVHFHIENHLEASPQMLIDLAGAVESPNLDINLDMGHAHALSATPLVTWIERLGSLIGYTHIHDNHGVDDDHLGFGMGNSPLEEALLAMQQYAPGAIWAIEANPPYLRASIDWLTAHNFIA